MNITRHNYEEFFVLYMDNELGSADRHQVELFIQDNADLRQELDWMLQSRLVPDTSVVFDKKDQLMKASGIGSLNLNNYEEWLLLYTDNELPAEQKITVEQFASAHPVVKSELDILQKTKLQPQEEIVFPNKEILYHKEEKVRKVAIGWWKIAVAAALLIAVSTTAFIVFYNSKEEIISANLPEKKSLPQNSSDRQSTGTTTQANTKTTENSKDLIPKAVVKINNQVAVNNIKNSTPKVKNTRPSDYIIKERMPDVSNSNTNKKKTNDLPQPLYNPNVNKGAEQNNSIAKKDVTEKTSLTNPKETNELSTVTTKNPQPLDHIITVVSAGHGNTVDEEQPGRKNKLRGIFRKITRTFEKNTNIKATDDEERLLLGGLAIKL